MPNQDINALIDQSNKSIEAATERMKQLQIEMDRLIRNIKARNYLHRFSEVAFHFDEDGMICLDHDDDRIHFMLWQK